MEPIARVSNRVIRWGSTGSRAPRGQSDGVEAVTDEIGRSRYLISDGMSTVDGYQFIKIIGARAEILSGAKPTRIVGAVGTVVDRSVLRPTTVKWSSYPSNSMDTRTSATERAPIRSNSGRSA